MSPICPDFRSHLKSRQFATLTLFDHSKSRLVRDSDPHWYSDHLCTYYMFVLLWSSLFNQIVYIFSFLTRAGLGHLLPAGTALLSDGEVGKLHCLKIANTMMDKCEQRHGAKLTTVVSNKRIPDWSDRHTFFGTDKSGVQIPNSVRIDHFTLEYILLLTTWIPDHLKIENLPMIWTPG